ncbi:MAG: hypothetical protein GNW80_12340, partial [Asgard group archaeon]|nr:hypothetical protein [Asgard group archaeon]
IVRQNKTRRILLIILAIFMILVIIPAIFLGGFFVICFWGEVSAILIGIAIIIGGLASCIFGIGILINQRYR